MVLQFVQFEICLNVCFIEITFIERRESLIECNFKLKRKKISFL